MIQKTCSAFELKLKFMLNSCLQCNVKSFTRILHHSVNNDITSIYEYLNLEF